MESESRAELDCDLAWLKSTSLYPVASCEAWCSPGSLVEAFPQVVSFSLEYIHRHEIAGQMVTLCLFLKSSQTKLKVVLFCIPTTWVWGFRFFYNLAQTCPNLFLVIAFLVGGKCYLTVTLIYMSLTTNDVEYFLCTHWPFIYLL